MLLTGGPKIIAVCPFAKWPNFSFWGITTCFGPWFLDNILSSMCIQSFLSIPTWMSQVPPVDGVAASDGVESEGDGLDDEGLGSLLKAVTLIDFIVWSGWRKFSSWCGPTLKKYGCLFDTKIDFGRVVGSSFIKQNGCWCLLFYIIHLCFFQSRSGVTSMIFFQSRSGAMAQHSLWGVTRKQWPWDFGISSPICWWLHATGWSRTRWGFP